MIETVDDIAAARQELETAKREVTAAQAEFDRWLATRHEQGFKATSLDLDQMRIVPATAVDSRGWEHREGQLRASVNAARCRMQDAEDRLRNVRLKNPDGAQCRVELFRCHDQDGDPIHRNDIVRGVVGSVCGPFVGVRLAEPMELKGRKITEVFTKRTNLKFID